MQSSGRGQQIAGMNKKKKITKNRCLVTQENTLFFAVTANKLKCKLHKIVAVLAAVLGKKEVSGWALVDLDREYMYI